jgi:nitrous oxide reductase
MFYTKETSDQLTLEQAKKALKLLTKTHDMEKPISQLTPEEHQTVDLVCDTYNYLQDRIYYIETCDRLDAARPTKEKRALAAEQEQEQPEEEIEEDFKTNFG